MNIVRFNLDPLQPFQEGLAVIKGRMHKNARHQGKSEEVCHGVGCWEVKWGVLGIGGLVESIIYLKNDRDVIIIAETIVWSVGRYREMGHFPSLNENAM
jgi:hypothetical protein